jgi:nucleoside-diphosphate-sugar epimerase
VRVVVTGSEGYIGCLLAPYLVEQGYEVIGVDSGFYKAGWLYNDGSPGVETLNKDIRQLDETDFDGVDAVVHMAELSNDPLGQMAPSVTREINHRGSVHVASKAKAAGVSRFVYTSSCSVYGAAVEDLVDEESPLAPQTEYAVCKELVEREVGAMADDAFSPTFLRNATAYGSSPRLRFDIVLNNLAGLAWTTREIRMESDGTPWRPLVHVLDICQTIYAVLEAPRETVHGQILNTGAPEANYQIREVADLVGRVFPDCEVTVGDRGADQRSYRVAFAKLHDLIPGLRFEWNPDRGARQLLEVFSRVGLSHEDFVSRRYTRLRQIDYLLRTNQIDASLFWRPFGPVSAGTTTGDVAATSPS